jgi:hypothetical protein
MLAGNLAHGLERTFSRPNIAPNLPNPPVQKFFFNKPPPFFLLQKPLSCEPDLSTVSSMKCCHKNLVNDHGVVPVISRTAR